MAWRNLSGARVLGGIAAAGALASGVFVTLGVLAPAVSGATTPSSSKTLAGYGESLSGSAARTVAASFAVPALDCATTPSTAGTLAGQAGLFGGVGTKNFLTSIGAVAGECKNGSAVYAGAVIAGKTVALADFVPAAGDTVRISAAESAAGSSVTITDVTQDKSFTKSGTGVAVQGAEVGLTPKNATSEIPTFASVGFSAKLDGAAFGSSAKAFNLVNGGTTEISTGPMTRGTSSTWTETFENN